MATINLSQVNQSDNVVVEWTVNPPGNFSHGNIRCEYDVATNGGITTAIPPGQGTTVGSVAQCRTRQRDHCACIILDPRSLTGDITVSVTITVGTQSVLTLVGNAGTNSPADSAIIDERLRFI